MNMMTFSEIKETGSHYTPTLLANFVAENIKKHSQFNTPKVLDPACGDGSLLKAIKLQIPSANLFGFDLNTVALSKTTYETQAKTENIDFLDYILNYSENDLFSVNQEKFDIVIANPPYIRTQILGEKKSQRIAKDFSLNGRVDIYYAFLEGIYRVLNENGIAGVIVSNRFMSIKSGSVVRKRLLEHFDIIHIWDFGDTKIFSAAVLPAVLLLKKKKEKNDFKSKMTTIYSTRAKADVVVDNIFYTDLKDEVVSVDGVNYKIQNGELDSSNDVWKIKTKEISDWQQIVDAHTTMRFKDIGKIRVGIKTTADKVFVKKNWDEQKPELLKPLVTHDDARRFKSYNSEWSVLYTHEIRNGKKTVVDISKYPNSEKYLQEHKDILSNRSYIKKAKRQWYEIWVPQQPDLWEKPKLVFPDISEKPIFWMSLKNEVIQGNCYWIVSKNENSDLLWLAMAVGNSSFIEEYYDNNFNNKLYACRRRFMTQYVENFPLPDATLPLSKKIIELAKEIYSKIDNENTGQMQAELNELVYKAFGL